MQTNAINIVITMNMVRIRYDAWLSLGRNKDC